MYKSAKIYFLFQKSFRLNRKKEIRKALSQLFKSKKKKLVSLNFIFCSDNFLLKINQKFLKHDFWTDVITFDFSQDESEIEGEIYISIERVRENAKKLNLEISKELLRVIFHGALHLCGYEDKNLKQIAEMRKKENQMISFMNVSRETKTRK
jgi:rRNA maturation RNase YbeY